MKLVLQYLLLLFVATTISTTVSRGIPRLSPFIREPTETGISTPVSGHFETFYYNQTPDRFNFKPESYATFPQKYVVNSKFWGGANVSTPILLASLGAEFLGVLRDISDTISALYTKEGNHCLDMYTCIKR